MKIGLSNRGLSSQLLFQVLKHGLEQNLLISHSNHSLNQQCWIADTSLLKLMLSQMETKIIGVTNCCTGLLQSQSSLISSSATKINKQFLTTFTSHFVFCGPLGPPMGIAQSNPRMNSVKASREMLMYTQKSCHTNCMRILL